MGTFAVSKLFKLTRVAGGKKWMNEVGGWKMDRRKEAWVNGLVSRWMEAWMNDGWVNPWID